ncbi:hypothetical protein Q3G72_028519 [Acer saccharum]|nr:hypothetical protein Q3G72_028519 [Acer saccharum]
MWGSADAKLPLPVETSKSYEDLEEIAKKERRRIEDSLKGKGLQYGLCPKVTVPVKGQKSDVARLHEDTDPTFNRFWWHIRFEPSLSNASVTVILGKLSPNAAVEGGILLRLDFVDICHALPNVPSHLLLRFYFIQSE